MFFSRFVQVKLLYTWFIVKFRFMYNYVKFDVIIDQNVNLHFFFTCSEWPLHTWQDLIIILPGKINISKL